MTLNRPVRTRDRTLPAELPQHGGRGPTRLAGAGSPARPAPPWSSRPPTAHIAPCLGDVRCWELAFLPAQIQGRWFCLHLILDLYSRKIVGSRCVTLTVPSTLLTWLGERPSPRGACRAGTPGAARLQRRNPEGSDGFGHAAPSCSRRRVGDDNAFAEALSSIPKYRPKFPPRALTTPQAPRRRQQAEALRTQAANYLDT
jgi:putative transposase